MSRSHGPTKAVPPIPARAPGPAPVVQLRSPQELMHEMAVRNWIEAMTMMKLGDGDLCVALRSGIELCVLLNRIQPDLIKKINRVNQPFLELENIGKFVLGARALGVTKADVIQAADLCDALNPARVISCMMALARCAETIAPDLPRLDLNASNRLVNDTKNDTQKFTPRPSVSISPIDGAATIIDVSSVSALESQLKRRQSSIILQREVDQLREEKQQLEKATHEKVAQFQQLQAVDQNTIGKLQMENQKTMLELDQMRTALKKAEIDMAIQKKQAEADRLQAMTQQQRAVQEATEQLEQKLAAQHRRELEQLKAASKAALDQRKRQIQTESQELGDRRSRELEKALQRIAELEQSQDSNHNEEILRIKQEARVQLAVESERIRLEADQRAIEQVRLQAERAKQEITAQVTGQCQLELAKLKGQLETDVVQKTTELQAESRHREQALRKSLEIELKSLDSLGTTLEQERALRMKYEEELQLVRDELERKIESIRDEQVQQQAKEEAQLRKEFEDELQRMKDVLEQKVRSEERLRVEERRKIEEKYRAEAAELNRKHLELLKKQADLETASAEDRAGLERTVKQLKDTIKQLEAQAQVRSAVEQERDRFMAKIAELENEKRMSQSVYEQRLREVTEELTKQRSALAALQDEFDVKLNEELVIIRGQGVAAHREAELQALRLSQDETLNQYKQQIEKLNRDILQDREDIERRIQRQYEEKLGALQCQLDDERRLVKALKSELSAIKKFQNSNDSADTVQVLQKALLDMGATHSRDVDALKTKFAQEMTKAIETLRAEYEAKMGSVREHDDRERLIASYEQKLEAERSARLKAEAALAGQQKPQPAATVASVAPPPPPPPAVGAPPPPPPPPPAVAPPPPPAATSDESESGPVDLLSALRNQPSLKKIETNDSQQKLSAQAELLEAIRSRPKLRKVSERKLPHRTSSTGSDKGPGGLMGMMGMMNIAQIAAQKAAARKKRIQESQSDVMA